MSKKQRREDVSDVVKVLLEKGILVSKGKVPRIVPPKAWDSYKPPGGQLRGRLPSKPKPAKRDEG